MTQVAQGVAQMMAQEVTELSLSQMFLYLTFPVGVFWVSNQAEFFQRHVIDRKVGEGTLGDILGTPWGHPPMYPPP